MVGVTGGLQKAILGALDCGFLDALVTNELVAFRLLQLEREFRDGSFSAWPHPLPQPVGPFGEEYPLGLAIPRSPRSYCQRANVHYLSECSKKESRPGGRSDQADGGSAGLMYRPSPGPVVALVTLDGADGGA